MVDIQELSLEDVMGDRFGRYSKYIIQDRALPDIRDGLKPVQRRILYAMYQDGNTADHNFRKSAKTVGNVIGNYHPHGDSSVYEAMVRMSQDWKNREVLIEMHGNNGSMDGDSAAAMRYTEARLSKIAGELLKDLDKDTVATMLNFDDTTEEPTVLPAAYPNLLVNGASGISAGYATEIPTHNLGEVIDATVYLIDHPKATLNKLMDFVSGPDFPTGGIIQGKDGIEKAYRDGRGKIVVRARYSIEKIRGGKQEIVITEIPFEVNKANLVRRMDEIRLNKSIDGMAEVRDESDRNGLRIVVELKRDANADAIIQYLFKNSDLQVNYNFNMVAIHEQRPEQLGLKAILQAYIDHRQDIIQRRTRFDLDKAQSRLHIVDGLVKALSILDEVIQTIRQSKNKRDAKENLVTNYDFTDRQAEAIVSLQLYRLTNTDVTALKDERLDLNEAIAHYQAILSDDKVLFSVMKNELRAIKKAYASPRLSEIQDQVDKIVIDKELLIAEETVMTVVTQLGYVKRTSLRSVKSSGFAELGLREGDQVLYVNQHSTLDNLVILTSKGNYIFQPVYELQDIRWKDLGEHLSQRIPLANDENIIAVYPYDQDSQATVLLATSAGMIKQSRLADFSQFRGHKSKASVAMKLSHENDQVLAAYLMPQADQGQVLIFTELGFALRYAVDEVNTVGPRAKGVKSVNLKKNDQVVAVLYQDHVDDKAQMLLASQRGHMKRLRWEDINVLGRAKRGLASLKELKTNPHRLVAAFMLTSPQDKFEVFGSQGTKDQIKAGDIPLAERYGNGSKLLDEGEFGQVTRMRRLLGADDFEVALD
ncbi:DNA topoisomerase IV subunit A [Aerococcus kribbianus]|uniref:DNA topoisomerase 4 subunit A n=1 Tax=Aerococcus kribbianus TaxID=2999064 RepID=A0A9X3FLN6_9LACT|nr:MULTISPECIES: DNA topoisomerase IV subunit A [unclassified Aerococcus]MCZ0716802.1 DNA topoisomerase IV subunit A [Aerococcus sp. YH-aer221]MCZ0725090.1 DNA topoisomerase IV subunit A [Aerococcus sp. YH-aer222]